MSLALGVPEKHPLSTSPRNEFEKEEVPILGFNPWMFSGTAQLVESFFIELAAQLKIHSDLAEIGEKFEAYGEIFSGLGMASCCRYMV